MEAISNFSLPFDSDVIRKFTKLGNSVIFVLVIIASIMFMADKTDCYYLGILNGLFVMTFMLVLLGLELGLFPPDFTEKLRNDMRFLFRPLGRLLVSVYVALMLFGFGFFGILMGVIMTVATAFNAFLFHRHRDVLNYSQLDEEEAGGASMPPAGASYSQVPEGGLK
uniref:Uncharacterized protein n=1 Tax=Rhizochromulina marina TaxID=1034831 RepID=A0A7S2RW01_9STRA|mmetsp:Transcript_21836/g.63537  ORF Transcript_21836/g.63537 Transcript_21836/m.63537 type:complete len:167 (+) Transcript_21836:102-602(+)|eukprot:CAMPEP_0118964348 /NCGR_PEP_ID=MMETSP1173-20130426/2065_1 /TAXON_ID=1034831 /ORGANISM="Rhizochromulina marina cf, Strain CCMP1243" /LENGTH=166 /DNA_ID=CAMNT_0006912795 /DNA_START=107 /DNA_END=607 /DNA_ORIENTATION=-